jgi:putative ABC transport system substrate-binding protein
LAPKQAPHPPGPESPSFDTAVRAQPDVIYAGGAPAIRAAQQATKTIPIIGITDDILAEGFVASLARPDGNTTGVSILATELDGKRQEILIEAVPGLRRMAALADSNNITGAKLDALREAARARNIELSIQVVAKGEEIAAAIDMAQASGASALNVLASPMLFDNRQLIMDRVAALRLPAIYQCRKWGRKAALPPTDLASHYSILSLLLDCSLRSFKVPRLPTSQ